MIRTDTMKETTHAHQSAAEVDKMATSLTNEQLAKKVLDKWKTFRPRFEEWMPLAIKLHERFEELKKEKSQKTILGCRTWREFCDKKLGYSDRHVRRLMEGENPAKKFRPRAPHRKTSNLLDHSEQVDDQVIDVEAGPLDPGLTRIAPLIRANSSGQPDQYYIDACVRSFREILQPLKISDYERFCKVVTSVGRAITDDLLPKDQSVAS